MMKTQNGPYFYPNKSDDLHCSQAVIRMILKHFLPEKKFSWDEIDKLTGFKKGLWTWDLKSSIELAKMGFNVYDKALFDYERFSKEKGQYLIERYGKEVGEAQIKNSDILSETKRIREYLKLVKTDNTIATLRDIKRLLKDGYLVVCNVNSRVLANKKGYVGHFVLVFDVGDNKILLHDPGLPPKPNRKVPVSIFQKAWAPKPSDRGLMAYKYSKRFPK